MNDRACWKRPSIPVARADAVDIHVITACRRAEQRGSRDQLTAVLERLLAAQSTRG